MLLVSGYPAVEARPSHAEVAACPGNMTDLLGVAQYHELALSLAFLIGHRIHPPRRKAALWKMSRESVQSYTRGIADHFAGPVTVSNDLDRF